MLDTWSQNTLELAAIIAPRQKARHSRSHESLAKSLAMSHTHRPNESFSGDISHIESLDDSSSFVSESTNTGMSHNL